MAYSKRKLVFTIANRFRSIVTADISVFYGLPRIVLVSFTLRSYYIQMLPFYYFIITLGWDTNSTHYL